MEQRRALIVWGGWEGHEPEKVAGYFQMLLEAERFEVETSNTLECFREAGKLAQLHLIVPIWTMGAISPEQRDAVLVAVREHGVGIAGCHGGMCDSFREDTEWQFMTGGQWVAHPGNDGVLYRVNIDRSVTHPITTGLRDFDVISEQYYMHVDPANVVLATTDFPNPAAPGPHDQNRCKMPVVWVKTYGRGRVFYTSLGHHCDVLEAEVPTDLIRRGFLWAAKQP